MATLQVSAEPGSQNIISVVNVSAPLEKVFEAFTNKDLVAQWWSQGEPMTIDYYEPVSGGKWRFGTPGVDGVKDAFHGCFHQIDRNTCIIQTFEYEGMPEYGHVALERADFKDIDDKQTEIRITTTFQSVEDRDGMVGAGMEAGYRESINALGKLLEG